MIDIQVKGDGDPEVLAELIASTLHGHVIADPSTPLACAGKLVREQQEQAESKRPSRNTMETVNFKTIDDDSDWSDV